MGGALKAHCAATTLYSRTHMFKRIRRSQTWHAAAAVVTAIASGITTGALNPDDPNMVALAFITATALLGFAAVATDDD